jgi:hypothetical protein
MSIRWSRSPWVASLLITILISPNQDPLHAQAPATKPASTKTSAPVPVTPPPGTSADTGWPRTLQLQNGSLTWFQPQVESWTDRKKMVAWSAVAYTPLTATQAALGTIKIEASTQVSLDENVVSLDYKIVEYNFPSLSSVQVRAMVSEVETIPIRQRVLDLDRVLAYVDDSPLQARNTEGLKADPPKIYQAPAPAILLNIEGEPIWSPIKDLDLKYVVNTNWDLFEHTPTKTLYLRHEKSWLQATDVKGPWEAVKKLPDSFKKLPADDNWKDVKEAVPGKKFSSKTLPKVFVSLDPAELIVIDGPIAYKPVTGAGELLWVSNTEADLFRMGKTGDFYFLVAGRWFKSASLDGPWTFTTPMMPEEFKKIPIEHERSRVLVSVPGTPQANEAIQLASIPRTARVSKRETKAPEVIYQGAGPEFKTIEGASGLQYAVNTDKDIVRFGDLYYMCFQGVWFMSKAATGPWEVASTVPKEIYTIPPSSPVNHVTYVTVEDNSDDEWVTFAYVAAYTGMMIGYGCVMWGTGWYYPPYVWGGGYYGYPHTYGMGAWYNPYTGAYGRGYGAYGPYGGVGMGASYNPRTGTYARGASAYGPYGSRSYGQAYNPRTGTYAQTRQGSNVYGNWGSSTVQRGDSWAQTAHADNYRNGTSTSAARTSSGAAAISRTGPGGSQGTIARTAGGDVYAGRDGNVYRKTDGGNWEQGNGSGGWSPVNGGGGDRPSQLPSGGGAAGADRPSQTPSASTRPANNGNTATQLNRDSAARSAGNQRATTRSTMQSGGGMSRSSAGSMGGGRMGGGGGRRR